jgi:hypothetical protein
MTEYRNLVRCENCRWSENSHEHWDAQRRSSDNDIQRHFEPNGPATRFSIK